MSYHFTSTWFAVRCWSGAVWATSNRTVDVWCTGRPASVQCTRWVPGSRSQTTHRCRLSVWECSGKYTHKKVILSFIHWSEKNTHCHMHADCSNWNRKVMLQADIENVRLQKFVNSENDFLSSIWQLRTFHWTRYDVQLLSHQPINYIEICFECFNHSVPTKCTFFQQSMVFQSRWSFKAVVFQGFEMHYV